MDRGFRMNPLRIDLSSERGDLDFVFLHAQPALDHAVLDFEVKLKTVNARAVAESLIGAKRGEGEMPAGFRNIEGFAVPLKYFLRLTQCSEQRVVLGLLGRRDIVPADFFFQIRINSRAKGFRNQLGAQA